MRALVTGGVGFAGSHLCEHLAARGFEVFALAKPGDVPPHLPASALKVFTADVRDPGRLRHVFAEVRPDRVYHLAAFATPSEGFQDPAAIHEINVGGTGHVCEAMVATVPEARLLFVSSGDVYGDVVPEALPLSEENAAAPSNPYAESKADAETVVSQFRRIHHLHAVVARPFNHTGPRQSPGFLCPGVARQVALAMAGGPRVVRVGNLDVARDFNDVRDIVAGYELLLDRGAPGEVYNLASGKATPVRWIVERLCSFASIPLTVETDPALVRPTRSMAVAGDAAKARKLGWQPRYKLENTLSELLSFWMAQPAATAHSARR